MKNIYSIVVISLMIVTMSCTNQSESEVNSDLVKNTYNIELVDSKKWEVNQEMMIHIKNMESDIENASNNASPNYKELGSNLMNNINLLTSNCTMTGKAHDELHKWLVPFIDLVDKFNNTVTLKQQEVYFEEIKESMNEFNTYFK